MNSFISLILFFHINLFRLLSISIKLSLHECPLVWHFINLWLSQTLLNFQFLREPFLLLSFSFFRSVILLIRYTIHRANNHRFLITLVCGHFIVLRHWRLSLERGLSSGGLSIWTIYSVHGWCFRHDILWHRLFVWRHRLISIFNDNVNWQFFSSRILWHRCINLIRS